MSASEWKWYPDLNQNDFEHQFFYNWKFLNRNELNIHFKILQYNSIWVTGCIKLSERALFTLRVSLLNHWGRESRKSNLGYGWLKHILINAICLNAVIVGAGWPIRYTEILKIKEMVKKFYMEICFQDYPFCQTVFQISKWRWPFWRFWQMVCPPNPFSFSPASTSTLTPQISALQPLLAFTYIDNLPSICHLHVVQNCPRRVPSKFNRESTLHRISLCLNPVPITIRISKQSSLFHPAPTTFYIRKQTFNNNLHYPTQSSIPAQS